MTTPTAVSIESTTATLIAQLRTVLDLTHTEIQVAETRVAQARTEAVRRELTQNAENGRTRAIAIEKAIRDLGGFPDVIGPFLGRAAAAVKALTEQAEPFDEALLGDLALEGQLLDRARYVKALAVSAKNSDVEDLAGRLITAHTATVEWLTTVLAEDALGGPAALRRTPLQAATGLAVKFANLPFTWSTRGAERVAEHDHRLTDGGRRGELERRGGGQFVCKDDQAVPHLQALAIEPGRSERVGGSCRQGQLQHRRHLVGEPKGHAL